MFQNRSCSKIVACPLREKLNNIGINYKERRTLVFLFYTNNNHNRATYNAKNEVSCIAIHFRWGSLFNIMTLLGLNILHSSDGDLEKYSCRDLYQDIQTKTISKSDKHMDFLILILQKVVILTFNF